MSNTTRTNEVVSIAVQIQQTTWDCVLACVVMLTGRPYSEVFQGAPRVAKEVRRKGSYEKEMHKLAKGVGCKLRKQAEVNLDEDTGILFMESNDPAKASHAAVLFRGTLIDPSTGLLWDPTIYLAGHPYLTVECLYVLT